MRGRPDDPLTSDARGSPRQSPSRKERDETVAAREGSQRGSAFAPLAMGEGGQVRGRRGNLPDPDQPHQADAPLQPRLEPRAFQQRRQDDHSPPFPPREFVHAPGAPATRPTSQRNAPTRAGSPHAPYGGWGAHGGGLGWDQGCSEGLPLAA